MNKPVDLQHDHKHDEKHHHQTAKNVKVTIDNKVVQIHRGSYIVRELKAILGVHQAKELDQLIDCQLTPLEDESKIVIKGGEEFISHVKAGGSS